MRYSVKAMLLTTILILTTAYHSQAQTLTAPLEIDPANAEFVYDDIHNFVRAFNMLKDGGDTLAILQAEYIDKATPGLKEFGNKYGLDLEKLVAAINKNPEKYADLHEIPELLSEREPHFRDAFTRLTEIYPDAKFPPTYFVVEYQRGIGSGSAAGQLIAVDRWKAPLDNKITMITHELTHMQQVMAIGYPEYVKLFGPKKSLLGLCIREGTAEFIADLVTGTITQDEALEWTLANEPRLKAEFMKDKDNVETGDWMWSKPEDPDQPRHVGYVIGYRIVESYYNNADDKARAIREILGVTDYQAFFENSGYISDSN